MSTNPRHCTVPLHATRSPPMPTLAAGAHVLRSLSAPSRPPTHSLNTGPGEARRRRPSRNGSTRGCALISCSALTRGSAPGPARGHRRRDRCAGGCGGPQGRSRLARIPGQPRLRTRHPHDHAAAESIRLLRIRSSGPTVLRGPQLPVHHG